MIRRPPRSTQSRSSAASDVYKRQLHFSCPTRKHRDFCFVCSTRLASHDRVNSILVQALCRLSTPHPTQTTPVTLTINTDAHHTIARGICSQSTTGRGCMTARCTTGGISHMPMLPTRAQPRTLEPRLAVPGPDKAGTCLYTERTPQQPTPLLPAAGR